MLSAAVVDIGMMLFSAVLNAGVFSPVTLFVVTGALPLLAIATVCAIEGDMSRKRWLRDGQSQGAELRHLAFRHR